VLLSKSGVIHTRLGENRPKAGMMLPSFGETCSKPGVVLSKLGETCSRSGVILSTSAKVKSRDKYWPKAAAKPRKSSYLCNIRPTKTVTGSVLLKNTFYETAFLIANLYGDCIVGFFL
jgi:hypothetical protein